MCTNSKMMCTYHTQNSLWLLLLNSWWDNNPSHKHYMSEILCPWRLSNYITLTLTINNGIQLTSLWFQFNQSRWFYFRVIYSYAALRYKSILDTILRRHPTLSSEKLAASLTWNSSTQLLRHRAVARTIIWSPHDSWQVQRTKHAHIN